jgi:hypothetical protein
MPTPATLVFEKNLPDFTFIENGVAKLEVEVNKDGANPVRTYSWYNGQSKIEDNNQNTYEATEPGIYKVNVTSNLNRTTEEIVSGKCKVYNDPVAPTIQKMRFKAWDSKTSIGDPTLGEYTKDVDIDPENIVRFAIETDMDGLQGEDSLISTELTYKWFLCKEDNNDYIELNSHGYVPEVDGEKYNFNNSYIDIKLLDIGVKYAVICEVSNILGEGNDRKVATTTSEPFNII